MSLCRFALRLCAVEALKGRTIAEGNIRNSTISAIDIGANGDLRMDEDRLFCDVFTDESVATDTDLRDLRQNGMVALNFESGIASGMAVTNPETGESQLAIGLPATDSAFEATLDILQRQITAALTDPTNEWSELWRKLSDGVAKIETQRTAREDDGTRRAARRLSLTLMAKPDPVYGEPLAATSVWVRFKAMVDANVPELSGVVDTMLGTPGAEVTPAILQRSRGNTAVEARALGYAPFYPSAPGALITTPILEDERDVDPA